MVIENSEARYLASSPITWACKQKTTEFLDKNNNNNNKLRRQAHYLGQGKLKKEKKKVEKLSRGGINFISKMWNCIFVQRLFHWDLSYIMTSAGGSLVITCIEVTNIPTFLVSLLDKGTIRKKSYVYAK